MQQTQSDVAHQELLDALKAQDEILQDLTDTTPASETPAPAKEDARTDGRRDAVEEQYGDRVVGADWEVKPDRGGDGPRGCGG